MKTNGEIEALPIGVVGAGSWGTALANLLADKGLAVDHWVYEDEVRQQMVEEKENQRFLPGVRLSNNLRPSGDLESVVAGKKLVLVVTPSHVTPPDYGALRPCHRIGYGGGQRLQGYRKPDPPDHVRGAERGDSRACRRPAGHPDRTQLCQGGGPQDGHGGDGGLQKRRYSHPGSADLRHTPISGCNTIDDVIGAELGAAVKNVIAIAAGVIDGLGLGLNTRAALITRGLVEIRRLGLALGAQPRTFTGLAGAGDLILTCTGDLSRNHTIGKQIGEGKKLKDLLAAMHMVAEGVKTARSVYNLSRKLGVEMPISHAVYHVLYDDLDPKTALHQLMTRDLKAELDEN